jgi:glutamate dehydrogenase
MSAHPKTVDPSDAVQRAQTDETLSIELVEHAGKILAQEDPALHAFFRAFCDTAPPEDIIRYSVPGLAALTRLVHAVAKSHVQGESIVRLIEPHDETKDYARVESLLVSVNDDMPFLLDSLLAEVASLGARVRAVFHPIVMLDAASTSVIALVLEPIVGSDRRNVLVAGVSAMFRDVRLAVRDWRAMTGKLSQSIAELKAHPPKISTDELAENLAFLEWLGDNHFTFLGTRDYTFTTEEEGRLDANPDSGLGILSDLERRVIRRGPDRGILTAQVRAFLTQPAPLIITKANERSLVHRRVHMDYVGVKIFDASGALRGERRFVGLFTSGAYSRLPLEIPVLRRKCEHVIKRAGLPPASHDGKALAHILDAFPRDELFQISEDELYATAMGALRLGERPKVKLFVRFDRFDRFVSIIAYVPRDRYDTRVRERIHAILARAFNGRMTSAQPMLDDSALARLHFIVGRNDGQRPNVDVRSLEERVRAAIRTWGDGYQAALITARGETEGRRLFQEATATFSLGYRGLFSPEEAVQDLGALETLVARAVEPPIQARAYRRPDDTSNALRIKLYVLGDVLPLSSSVPIFENLGLKVIAEDAFPVSLKKDGWGRDTMVLDFLMERTDDGVINLTDVRQKLEDAFHAIVGGAAESDGFNRLIIGAGLAWRDVAILRATAKYLRQVGIQFSQDYMEQALSRNPDIASLLVELFHTRNDPGEATSDAVQKLHAKLEAALNDVPSLDDDRIIRRIRNVIDCVLRTNFYQGGASTPKPYIAMKLDSAKLDELPAPRPLVEIFVYSTEVEGVHLRFGRVARGGIRWSDRREDFRTEVLGLVKAQQVKNAVIVPVGAKGGFFPKRLPVNGTREAVQAGGIAAYKTFINALLDVTDNIDHAGKIVPPEGVLRHDGDDPYLVVAADKGTATFSDIANGIAEGRGFWLGDAFASGGSHGYDHKKMGITARGAWEAVKRHFRELGRDIQVEPFTCVGVGDMSGDVFGNGMLLSKKTKLLAAFDHRHVFIDPDPNTEASWNERKRIFDLPRSSWDDYKRELISKGGGIFPRSAKEIALTPEMQALSGLTTANTTPGELIKALLKAQVDLLFFGGIGTFIKAQNQSNLEVGDRANDGLRVNGSDIRAKVVGEGANLGATQLGRVEYAKAGGRINTDAIDNSAGVDTSDHEVNLKILLSGPLRRGELSADARDTLLNEMTDDVAEHVLKDNYDQTLALSVAQSRAAKDLDAHGRFIRELESRGKLDRAVEFLPDDVELRVRAQRDQGLTRPELAVLLAYAKLDLDAEIIASDLPDDPAFAAALAGYFPTKAVEKFPAELARHRLHREIVADILSNRIVNLAGPVFVSRMKEMSGAPGHRVARAFVVAEGAFGLAALKARIDQLDGKIPAEIQTGMYTDIAEILRRLGLWFITNVAPTDELGATIALYRAGAEELRGTFASLVSPFEAQQTEARIHQLQAAGVPIDIAEDISVLPLMAGMTEIASLAHARGLEIDLVAGAYFAAGAAVGIDRLRGLAQRISGGEHWDRLAIRRINDDLFAGQRALASDALALLDKSKAAGGRAAGAEAVQAWVDAHADTVTRTKSFLAALEQSGDLSVAKLTLANSQIRELAAR